MPKNNLQLSTSNLLCRKDTMNPGWWTELRCDSVCLRSRHLSALPCSKRTTDSDAPTLRWASEFSQRENCHPQTDGFYKATSNLQLARLWPLDFRLWTLQVVKELPNSTTSPPRVMCPGNIIVQILVAASRHPAVLHSKFFLLHSPTVCPGNTIVFFCSGVSEERRHSAAKPRFGPVRFNPPWHGPLAVLPGSISEPGCDSAAKFPPIGNLISPKPSIPLGNEVTSLKPKTDRLITVGPGKINWSSPENSPALECWVRCPKYFPSPVRDDRSSLSSLPVCQNFPARAKLRPDKTGQNMTILLTDPFTKMAMWT